MNTVEEREKLDNIKKITKENDVSKNPWWKNIFKAIGNFFNKIFNTILYLIHRPSINETVKINTNFPTNPTNKEETEITQQEETIQKEEQQQTVEQLQSDDKESVHETIIEEEEIAEIPVEDASSKSENDTTISFSEDVESQDVLSSPVMDNDTVNEKPVVPNTTLETTEETEDKQNDSNVEETMITDTLDNVEEVITDSNVLLPTKVETFEELTEGISQMFDKIELSIIVPIVPEDNAYDVVVLTNSDNKTFTFSIGDTYEDAVGIETVSQKMRDELFVPQDIAKQIIEQLQENQNLVKQYTNEKRINMIATDMETTQMETREDLIQMALSFLNTPNRNKAKIEETRDEVFFVFPQDGSNLDDPDRTVISDEIKINLKNFNITKSVEYYNFTNGRNEFEDTSISKQDLTPTLKAIHNVLENNKGFIQKEFFQNTPSLKPEIANQHDYVEADEVLDDYKSNKHNKKTIRDARQNYAQTKKFEDDLASGEAFKTKAQRKAENRTKFVPNRDDLDY